MEKKKYYYNAIANRVQTYPDPLHYKMFIAECLINEIGQSAHLYEIIKKYYRENFTQSQRDFLIKKFEEDMIIKLSDKWQSIKQRGFAPAQINFLYDKVKFKKVMRLNIGFNETDFKWDIMSRIFNLIFTGGSVEEIKKAAQDLSGDLREHILIFYKEVREVAGSTNNSLPRY